MKKLLLSLVLLLMSQFVTAQVEDCSIKTRYTDFYKWDYTLEKYEFTGGDWMECYMLIRDDYYVIEIADMDPARVYWRYMRKTDDGNEVYETSDGRKAIFMYSTQSIVFFYEENPENSRYEKCMILSKTSKIDE